MKINIFLPFQSIENAEKSIAHFRQSDLVNKIYLLVNKIPPVQIVGAEFLEIDAPHSSTTIKAIAQHSDAEFSLLMVENSTINFSRFSLHRFVQIACNTNAAMLYSDYHQVINDKREPHPTIDYQKGSLRDDFDFGNLLFFNANMLKQAAAEITENYNFAGLYDLRLRISQIADIFHINEFLYSAEQANSLSDNEKQFLYVNPRNRDVQIEMEHACTQYLKRIEALVEPSNAEIDFDIANFPVEVSVIIPVRNRVKTIEDAILSAVSQTADFQYNVIVIDNHSTDGTSEKIAELAKLHSRIIHLLPSAADLAIGGCWNEGIFSEFCGKFAVQLDSDDVYSDSQTLQKIVDKFYADRCAMLVGSYTITDINLNPIPPYLIDHREWTDSNGQNNALRINGLGAPRAFFTPIIRQIKFPNTSYGEDYAVGLAISREYKIGRIYDSLYFCRRWEGNSDAALSVEQTNTNNFYKDKIRSIELMARSKRKK
jgi:hypothetical protein